MQNRLKISDPTKIVTLANFISLLRAVLAVPIVYTLRDPSLGSITLFLILIAILSDALDGWVARKADEVTYFGQWVDPIADFICLLSVTFYLVLTGQFPAWFFLFYIFRYLIIAVFAIYAFNRNQFFLSANWWGKWATGITALALLFHIWPWEAFPWLNDFIIYLATILMTMSWVVYIKDFYILFKK
jgi:CDP-diacylglycerol--glycerol-3-phosphate 3-phosphatidyltransferase